MEIYYDSLQEGTWFQGLNSSFKDATLIPINDIVSGTPAARALEYDRPDIILADRGIPILVIERTIEVPTGHNVGQRFARLAAAAEAKIPLVYFGPYMARKHGGATSGPRYMNLRLFYTLDILADINKSAVTTINWPVDDKCELLRTDAKDKTIKEYINLFLSNYKKLGLKGVNQAILKSSFTTERIEEREKFIENYVRAPKEYDSPPPSVQILSKGVFLKMGTSVSAKDLKNFQEVVLYNVGMSYVRSDPYTGTGMLYQYLYVLGEKSIKRALVLHFPHITKEMWTKASGSGRRKDVRLFKHIAELIIFKDGYWKREVMIPRSSEPLKI
jgi:hypothetical protein